MAPDPATPAAPAGPDGAAAPSAAMLDVAGRTQDTVRAKFRHLAAEMEGMALASGLDARRSRMIVAGPMLTEAASLLEDGCGPDLVAEVVSALLGDIRERLA